MWSRLAASPRRRQAFGWFDLELDSLLGLRRRKNAAAAAASPPEMEDREKLVRRMWDVYTRTGVDQVRLPRFWQEAFEAAYEELAGDDTQASETAVSEIARMSVHRPELEQSSNKY
ncbi:hypothetical protein DAI22_07g223800 [Oryza sativa Japonica Group]|nr:hypothetical protein DAI22_07g223800 [Oryza sativa Japonica Group]